MTEPTPTTETAAPEGAGDNVAAGAPEFAELEKAAGNTKSVGFQLDRFAHVNVVLTAELGRAQLTLQELMDLSEGSVVELNRNISAPVELIAQGVPLGNGEVVVFEDQFAIRITELYQNS